MLSGLLTTAFLMGLSGAPHCATMCGMPCAAALQRRIPMSALLGRWVSYALLGAIAASSAGWVSAWGREVAMFKPVWLMAQFAAVMLGLWMAWAGRVPAKLEQVGVQSYHRLKQRLGHTQAGLVPTLTVGVPFLAGMLWGAVPCGLLYGALMVAALAPDALSGAGVMTAFALPSAVGVWLAPQLLAKLKNGPWGDPRWAIRLAGLMLAAMAAWGLAHHLYAQWQAWCG